MRAFRRIVSFSDELRLIVKVIIVTREAGGDKASGIDRSHDKTRLKAYEGSFEGNLVKQLTWGMLARFRRLRWAALLLIVVVGLFVFRRPLFLGNFAPVVPGKVYRSSQPDRSLEDTIRRNGIGSVVNLRGGTNGDAFYRQEVEITDRLGVEFYDLPLSATRRPTRRELMLMIGVLDQCKYPLLIHCKWGADRTGLMSALYALAIEGETPAQALEHFTLRHGHFAMFGPERLHEPIEEYAAWLQRAGLEHTPARFRTWLEREYQSDDAFVAWPKVRPGRRPTVASSATDQR